MINFHSKLTKSIIIAIFILSLTISIYVVPASAIVTGTLSSQDLATIFNRTNYTYFSLRRDGVYYFPSETLLFDKNFYPFVDGANTLDPASVVTKVIGRRPGDVYGNLNSDFYQTATYPNYTNNTTFSIPLGVRGADKTTFTLFFIVDEDYEYIFDYLTTTTGSNPNFIGFNYSDSENVTYRLPTSQYFIYPDLLPLDTTLDSMNGNRHRYSALAIDITLYGDVNFLGSFIYFQTDVSVNAFKNFYMGISSFDFVGTNPQITDIQTSIDDLISQIQSSNEQYLEMYNTFFTVSPDGQLVVDSVKDNFQSSEDDLKDLIDGITVPTPEPEEILPDHDQIMGQYMDSGGSEALATVFTPIFDDKGPIYIMLFGVISIALISYVLYGKKA